MYFALSLPEPHLVSVSAAIAISPSFRTTEIVVIFYFFATSNFVWHLFLV